MDTLFAVQLFESVIEASEKSLVLYAVFIGAGKATLLQELFFALEMHLRELNQALELQADVAAVGSADEHEAQLVERVHQNPVLIVHGLHADDALVTPGQEGHISSKNKAKSSLTSPSLNGANVVREWDFGFIGM